MIIWKIYWKNNSKK